MNHFVLVLPENTFEKLSKLEVTGMTADPAWHEHPGTTIDKVFEGIDDFDVQHCYAANSVSRSQARLDIQPAKVVQVQLLNRGDVGFSE